MIGKRRTTTEQHREHFDSFKFPAEFTVTMVDFTVTWRAHLIPRTTWRWWIQRGWIEEEHGSATFEGQKRRVTARVLELECAP